MFGNYLNQAVMLILLTSCLPLLICSISSLILAILQTVTQIQEQTISYLVRFASISLVLYFCSSWFLQEYVSFFEQSLSSIRVLGQVR